MVNWLKFQASVLKRVVYMNSLVCNQSVILTFALKVILTFFSCFCGKFLKGFIYFRFFSIMGPQDPRILKSQDPKILGSQDPKILESQDPRIPGSQDPRILGSQDPKILGSQDPSILGSQDLREAWTKRKPVTACFSSIFNPTLLKNVCLARQ